MVNLNNVLQKTKNAIDKYRIPGDMNTPVDEIVLRSVPSDINKISFMSQLLSDVNASIIRMNFNDEKMSIISFDSEWTKNAENILIRHNVKYDIQTPDPIKYKNRVVVNSTPQFQYTKYSTSISINQESLDETRDEFVEQSMGLVLKQMSQTACNPDMMIRIRKMDDDEIYDLKESINYKLEKILQDTEYKAMSEVDGALYGHRATSSITHFSSIELTSLLQAQREDMMHQRSMYVYEFSVWCEEDDMSEIDGILKTIPNTTTEPEYVDDQEEKCSEYIYPRSLRDSTFPVASPTAMSLFIDFENGNLVVERQAVEFKVPPRNIFTDDGSGDILIEAGKVENTTYNASLKMKNEHTLIVGATNSGKTNTCFLLSDALIRRDVTLLVIEPTKGEWRNLAGFYDLSLYGINEQSKHKVICFDDPESSVALLFNPFTVPRNVSVDSHVQHVLNSFMMAFGDDLSAPQQAVLSGIIHALYDKYQNPNFSNLLEVIREYEDPDQQSQSFEWIKEALLRKMEPFTLGTIGHCFNVTNGLSPDHILSGNFVINLSWLKDDQMKNFITAMLLSSCTEWLEKNGTQTGTLKHQIMLEEAHRIFPNIPQSKLYSKEGSSVRVISQMLKEIRAYDTGVAIIDQSPSALFDDAILNTARKIALRVADGRDKKILEESMMLDEDQVMVMPSLEPGRSFVLDPSIFSDPFIIQFKLAKDEYMKYLEEYGITEGKSDDDNIRNLLGKSVSDKQIYNTAFDFYKSIGITWSQYTSRQYDKQGRGINNSNRGAANQVDTSQVRIPQQKVDTSNIKNIDDVVECLEESQEFVGVDLYEVVENILQQDGHFTCTNKYLCAAAVTKILMKDQFTVSRYSRDIVGDIFLRMVDYGVIQVDEKNNRIFIRPDFKCVCTRKPENGNKSNNSDVKQSEGGENKSQPENNEKQSIDVQSDKDEEVNGSSVEKGSSDLSLPIANVLVEDSGQISIINWYRGTQYEKSVLVFEFTEDKYDDDILNQLFDKCRDINSADINTIYICGSSDMITYIGTYVKEKISSNVTDIEIMSLLAKIKYETID